MATQKMRLPSADRARATLDRTILDIFNADYQAQAFDPDPGGGAVDSVNGQTGAVVLDATDVGAIATEPQVMKVFYIAAVNPTTTANVDSAFQGLVGRAPQQLTDFLVLTDFGGGNTSYLCVLIGSTWYGLDVKTGNPITFS